MKNFKWFLTVTSAIVALILASCAPGILPIASVTQNIVEVTANSTDNDLLDLASWCESKGILMLWYDFDDQPTGFTNRSAVFSGGAAADKNVYLNNVYVGNYGTTLDTIIDTIEAEASETTFSGNLILYLRADDLLGTSWDLIIGEAGQTRVVEVTNYVLVEFQKQGSVYKVTKVQVVGEWEDFAVPKDKSWDEIGTKGFAFFKIVNDIVVDARVIYPQ